MNNIPNYNKNKPIVNFDKLQAKKQTQENRKRTNHAVKLITASICYILNRDFGFGPQRLNRVVKGLEKFITEEMDGNETWADQVFAWAEHEGVDL